MKTMGKTSIVNIRIDPELKSELQEIYAHYGITLTEAINIFLHQSRNVGGLPFELRRTPTKETLEAIREVEEMKKNPSLGKSYTDVDEMVGELLE